MIRTKKTLSRFSIILLCCILITGCARQPSTTQDGAPKSIPRDLHKVKDAVPKAEPLSKYGNRFGKQGKSNSYVALKRRYHVMSTSKGYRKKGQASWYGTKFHGQKTSSGEKYDMFAMTAAHPTLPLPTYAKVTNLANGKSVVVKINDRGPFHNNRLIDLSYVAAVKLGIYGTGTGHVEVESIDPRDHGGPVPKTTLLAKHAPQKATPKTPPKPIQKMFLQLGAFSDRTHAEALIKKIGKLSNLRTEIAQTTQKNRPLFKVRIGPMRDPEDAIKLTRILAQAKLPAPVVVTEQP